MITPGGSRRLSPRLGVNGRLVPVDGVAGQDSVGLAVQHGEPAGAVEAPPVGDASDGPSGRVGGQEILAGAVQPDPQKVGPRRGLQMTGERQLHGTDGDLGGSGDVRGADVAVRVVPDERDRPARGGRVGVAAVLDGGVGQRVGCLIRIRKNSSICLIASANLAASIGLMT